MASVFHQNYSVGEDPGRASERGRPQRGKVRAALRETLSQGAVALTDRVFAALDRAKTRRQMEAMDERGRADIGWRRDVL